MPKEANGLQLVIIKSKYQQAYLRRQQMGKPNTVHVVVFHGRHGLSGDVGARVDQCHAYIANSVQSSTRQVQTKPIFWYCTKIAL